MNTAIKIIAYGSDGYQISTPAEALDCLATIKSNILELRAELCSLGLISEQVISQGESHTTMPA